MAVVFYFYAGVAQRLLQSVAARFFTGSSPVPRFLFKMAKKIIKKTFSESFNAILSGKKKFEIRMEDDCKFEEGDKLILKEIDNNKNFTGREIVKEIKFISRTKKIDYWDENKISKYGFTILGFIK